MAPKVLQKNNADRASGVLPMPASARQPQVPKQPATRLKLEVRRLPPGLTLTEFEETLGEEWKLGAGKIDWREYRQGKLKSPGKLPEQSRCYVHLTSEALVKDFEQRFLGVVFHDKAGTHKHAELRHLPPTLGFAPNQRVPSLAANKQKVDNRQGTIDQDAEYMAFLEAETMPIPRAAAIDSAAAAEEKQKEGKVKSTPLIEDLRERKAKKATAAAAKAEKKGHARAESKDGKVGEGKDKEGGVAAGAGKKGEKKVEQAARDAAKALNKQAAGKQAQTNSAASASSAAASSPQKGGQSPAKLSRRAAAAQAQQSPKPANAQAAQANGATSPAPQRGQQQRQRGNAEGIKKMLQKDLGIKPKPAAAQAQNTAASTNTSTPASTTSTPPSAPTNTKPTPQPKPTQQQQQPHLHKAYLKHANPSQGMTEILIQQALSVYGEMGNVTIDPRKGTAIAVFKTHEGMKKAVEAKKISVAKGAVEVMEFRDRNGGGGGGGGGGRGQGGVRGGRGGRRGGGNAGGNAGTSGGGSAPAAAAG